MKDTFSDSNYTQSDVAKGWFKKHWMSSSSANQNPSGKTMQRRLMTGGSGGYGAPTVFKYVEVDGTSSEEGS